MYHRSKDYNHNWLLLLWQYLSFLFWQGNIVCITLIRIQFPKADSLHMYSLHPMKRCNTSNKRYYACKWTCLKHYVDKTTTGLLIWILDNQSDSFTYDKFMFVSALISWLILGQLVNSHKPWCPKVPKGHNNSTNRT